MHRHHDRKDPEKQSVHAEADDRSRIIGEEPNYTTSRTGGFILKSWKIFVLTVEEKKVGRFRNRKGNLKKNEGHSWLASVPLAQLASVIKPNV